MFPGLGNSEHRTRVQSEVEQAAWTGRKNRGERAVFLDMNWPSFLSRVHGSLFALSRLLYVFRVKNQVQKTTAVSSLRVQISPLTSSCVI